MARDPEEIRREIEDTRTEMGETVEALAYKADVKGRASNWVSDKKDAVVGKVSGTKDSVTGTVGDRTPDTEGVKQGARRGVQVARENPLGLAIGGAAAGFIAGLLAPSTRVEDERIGDVADELKGRARETGREAFERGKQVAQEAGQAATETAKESGQQHAEELRGSAQEATQSVADSARQKTSS
jgi:hypothetical protein